VDGVWLTFEAKTLKERFYNDWQRLRLEADRNWHALNMKAQEEGRAARLEWQRKQDVLKTKKDIAATEEKLVALKRRLAQLTS
jgi:hypothetical protein